MIRLENEYLHVEIRKKGAEVSRIYNKVFNMDYLWNGDRAFWGRTSPVLFPIVGKLKNNQYIYENKTYTMSGHGFARDMEFEIINCEKEKASFLLRWTNETLQQYPFYFELVITYELVENEIKVNWKVKNCGMDKMYFSIGAHPAFRIPLVEGTDICDYYLSFIQSKVTHHYSVNINNGLITGKKEEMVSEKQMIEHELFRDDALIYDGIKGMGIWCKKHHHGIQLDFEEFPYVGVWSPYQGSSKNMAPFVCIEPWHGIADDEDTEGILEEKRGIQQLESKEEFSTTYTILIK